MTSTFKGHNPVKLHIRPNFSSRWDDFLQILTQGNTRVGAFERIKEYLEQLVGPTRDVRKDVTFSTILQKYVFDHDFWTKELRMTILVSRSMFLRARNLQAPYILTYDLDL